MTADDGLIAMHRAVAAYHEELAEQTTASEVKAYHAAVARVLKAEAILIGDRRARGSPSHTVAMKAFKRTRPTAQLRATPPTT
jgi:hypothetical protein